MVKIKVLTNGLHRMSGLYSGIVKNNAIPF